MGATDGQLPATSDPNASAAGSTSAVPEPQLLFNVVAYSEYTDPNRERHRAMSGHQQQLRFLYLVPQFQELDRVRVA